MFSVYIHVQTVYVARGIIIIRRNYKVLAPQVSLYIISGAWHEHPKSFQKKCPPKIKNKKKSVKSSPPLNYTYVCIYSCLIDYFFPYFPVLKKKLQLQESGGSLLHQLWATKRRTKIQQAAGQVLMKFQQGMTWPVDWMTWPVEWMTWPVELLSAFNKICRKRKRGIPWNLLVIHLLQKW